MLVLHAQAFSSRSLALQMLRSAMTHLRDNRQVSLPGSHLRSRHCSRRRSPQAQQVNQLASHRCNQRNNLQRSQPDNQLHSLPVSLLVHLVGNLLHSLHRNLQANLHRNHL